MNKKLISLFALTVMSINVAASAHDAPATCPTLSQINQAWTYATFRKIPKQPGLYLAGVKNLPVVNNFVWSTQSLSLFQAKNDAAARVIVNNVSITYQSNTKPETQIDPKTGKNIYLCGYSGMSGNIVFNHIVSITR